MARKNEPIEAAILFVEAEGGEVVIEGNGTEEEPAEFGFGGFSFRAADC